MTSCNHHPIFQTKLLFSRNPKYICKNCGVSIDMTPRTKMIGKLTNGLTIGVLVYMALNSGGTRTGETTSLLSYFGIMFGIIVVYLFLQALLLSFGSFQEIEVKGTPEDTADGTDPEPEEPKPQYTQEQLELMALYESYAKKARDEGEEDPSSSVFSEAAVPEADTCEHTPAKTWKNYIPGVYDFKCEHCGKTITFSAARKRKLNLVLLAFASVVLFTSFSNQNIPFWGFSLMTLGVVVVCSGVQYFFVKNSIFETKAPGAR